MDIATYALLKMRLAAVEAAAEEKSWTGTQAEYDALTTYESDRTYYIIVEDATEAEEL